MSKLNEMNFSEREKEKYSLQEGDLLMCEGGEIGRCAIWSDSDIEIYYQKALHRVRPKPPDVSVNYLNIYRQFIASLVNLTRLVGETSIAHLTREKLLGFPISFPMLPEQKAIAEALTASQHEIDQLKQLTERYKTQKGGLMQKMRTGDWRVKPEIVKNFEE